MAQEVLFLMYFALPGALANMAPVFAAKGKWFPALNIPLDGGQTFRGKRLLGDNKTLRGFFVGFLFALVVVLAQLWLYQQFVAIRDFSRIEYSGGVVLGLAAAMTIGALGGDAVKSFFKRQVGIKPGHTWVPFDQADSVIGIVLISTLYVDASVLTWLLATVLGTLLHPMSTTVAWLLKLKDHPL